MFPALFQISALFRISQSCSGYQRCSGFLGAVPDISAVPDFSEPFRISAPFRISQSCSGFPGAGYFYLRCRLFLLIFLCLPIILPISEFFLFLILPQGSAPRKLP
jgi:hypothetical protein